MSSPTQRALALYRDLGFTCQVVERFNSFSKVRVDLFGVIDIVAVHPNVGIVGVQACAGASHAARRDKAAAEPRLLVWLRAGGRFEVCSFSKRGDRGKRKVWTARREELVARGESIESLTAKE